MINESRCIPDPSAATWYENRPLNLDSDTVLVDLDGTLSDPDHRRHFLLTHAPDWDAFSHGAASDPPMPVVIDDVNARHAHMNIIISSGRPHFALKLTVEWLLANNVEWDLLALRPKHDFVRGVQHKLRVLEALRRIGIAPSIAIDDSPEMASAYVEEGIRCLVPRPDS